VSETNTFKLLEAGVLLAAGVAFAWWQLRDVAKARQASRAAAEQAAQQVQKQQGPEPEQALNVQSTGGQRQSPGATPGTRADT
jgi:predicted negative regulator of RcsB-dependent stress response